jgi:Tol biopolymer transport system component
MKKLGQIMVLFLLLIAAVPLYAQFYNGSKLSFGKNRVQHQKFNWEYFRDTQFDVYFYPTGKNLAEYTLYKAPQFISEIEKMLNFTSEKKIQFIVYNTQADFRESNFAYDDEDFYNQGGITNIYGTKVYLYFDGSHAHFDKMLKAGIMNIYAHLLVEGSTTASNIKSSYTGSMPTWYYNGLSSYIGRNWDSDIDAHVKDGILSQRYAVFDELSPMDATYAGHSFWKYIVDEYGEKAIPNILHVTRSSGSYERGFYLVTGLDYQQLLVNWFRYYYILYAKDRERAMPDGKGVLKRPHKLRDYNQFCFSPDGESYAYATNEAGQVKIWLKTPEKKKPVVIYRKYKKTEDNPDLSYPSLCWHPNGEILAFTMEDKGRCYYYPFDIEKRKLGKRILVDVEKITDFSFDPDGKFLLFSGFKNGQSDIFIFSLLAKSYQNITNDFYDDCFPVFLNKKQIVFSSNRPVDSVKIKDPFYQAKPVDGYNLFLYRYGQKDEKLLQITHSNHVNNIQAQAVSPREVLFLSDENGIYNQQLARLDSSISKIDTIIHYGYFARLSHLSDNYYSIIEQSYNPASGQSGSIILYDKVKRIYITPLASPLHQQELSNSSIKAQILKNQQIKDSLANIKAEKKKESTTKHGFYQFRKSDLVKKIVTVEDSVSNTGIKKGIQKDVLTKGFEYVHPISKNYYTQYTVNKLVTQADYGFLNTTYQQFTSSTNPIYLNTGINALFMVGLHDLFENHRITGGFRLGLDMQSNEFMISYENLSRRVDHQIVFYRQAISSNNSYYVYRQRANSLFYIIKLPFDKFNSIRFTLTGRLETNILGSTNDASLKAANEWHVWAGAKIEYVFDSSKELYTNLWKGSKIKLFAEYQQRVEKETKNLFVIGFDIRKSVKVYKNMTWATRLAASTNFGQSRLVYYMGGVDNWIGAKFNRDIWVDISKDYAYQTLATNMHGFEQNIRNGTSFIVLNTELRIPFIQLIVGHKVRFNFFNSMQLLLFGDFGTAWTGVTPYSEDNCLYTRYVINGPITAKITRQVEPFVGGFGLGLRVSVFGYFLRFDYAWGVEDYKIYNPKGMFNFSIGLDF